MATIPLQLAQRRLDTGTVASYPNGSPVGAAMQGFGDELSAIAERFRQQKQQQDAFDAGIIGRELNARIAHAEAVAVQTAPADGGGLHDFMYGQLDPRSDGVVKPGLFDQIFDDTVAKVPEGERANFLAQKQALRLAGSARMAAQQHARRQTYEQAEWSKVEQIYTSSIAQSDPNDTETFEAIRQSGLDLIGKMGNPVARQAAEAAWRSNTAKALVQAMIAQDPKRAAGMLGTGPVSTDGRTKDDIIEAVGGPRASGSSVLATREAPVGGLPSDEPPIRMGSMEPVGNRAWAAAGPWIADLSPDAIQDLGQKAQVATAASLVDARTNIDLAYQNAPAAIANTGSYSGKTPGAEDFTAVYGAEDGGKRLRAFNITADIGRAVFDMRPVPNQAIHAQIRDFEPGRYGAPEERKQYEIRAGAAQLVLGARRADPAGYVGQLFPNRAPDWDKITAPEDYKAAVTWAVAAQQELGFDRILPMPWAVAGQQAAKYIDQGVPFENRFAELSSIVLAVRDPDARKATTQQISVAAEAQWRAKAAQYPNLAPESLEAQVAVLKNGLAWIGEHPARAQYSTMPLLQQFGLALSDVGRLTAKGVAADGADAISAGLDSVWSSGNYENLLEDEQAETEDAEDRAASAGWVAEALGAGLSGYALATGLFGLLGRASAGAAAENGVIGLGARTGVAGVAGGTYGGAYAFNTGQSVPWGIANGALWGAGGNVLAEGLSAVGSQVVARLAERPANAGSAVTPEASGPRISEAMPDPLATDVGATGGGTSEISVGQDLHLYYMPEWDVAQRAAADLKVQLLTAAETVVSRAVRVIKGARMKFIAAGNKVPASSHVDHTIDLQLGGSDQLSNMATLDASVNTSLGSQIQQRIKHLPYGTKINKVTIGDRNVRDISPKLPGG
ncbi:hypothetical protein [Mesorhizobium sp. M0204]|uniref:hypothetical protein n=1 Tax=unclassified Mesorhizobium TaxID=325217 RepID=UPI00333D8325